MEKNGGISARCFVHDKRGTMPARRKCTVYGMLMKTPSDWKGRKDRHCYATVKSIDRTITGLFELNAPRDFSICPARGLDHFSEKLETFWIRISTNVTVSSNGKITDVGDAFKVETVFERLREQIFSNGIQQLNRRYQSSVVTRRQSNLRKVRNVVVE